MNAREVLEDCSYILLQPIVSTMLVGAVAAAGVASVALGSADSIYIGAQLVVDVAGANEEVITVTNLAGSTITATFAYAHAAGVTVRAPTFPKGQITHPLFTQDELLGYLQDSQNEFLAAVEPVVYILPLTIGPAAFIYDQPANVIDVKRIEARGQGVDEESQSLLDMDNPQWMYDTPSDPPDHWFRDRMDVKKIGFHPAPANTVSVGIWASLSYPTALALNTILLVPEPFCHILKYEVLSHVFKKDGEQKDPMRAKYCSRMFQVGIIASLKFIIGTGLRQLGESAELHQGIGRFTS